MDWGRGNKTVAGTLSVAGLENLEPMRKDGGQSRQSMVNTWKVQ
jgi:hypothetical protein